MTDDGKITSHSRNRPLAEAVALDARYYSGAFWHEFDQSSIIARHWQVLAPASPLKDTGDYIVREIGGRPILIVRGENGKLNGFFNICRHRAGPLALCDGRGAKRLRCAYHGWTYGLDGKLLKAPEMREARNFDKEKISLAPIDIQEWGGLIFAAGAQKAAVNFSDYISGVEQQIDLAALQAMTFHHSRRYEVDANWKVYIDNYLEGYHLPHVHPDLTAMVTYPEYKTELSQWSTLQRSPVGESQGVYEAGEALYFFMYPNTMLNILPGRMQTNRVIPVSPQKCIVEFSYYYAPGFEKNAAGDDKFSDKIQEEDRTICEYVQRALVSGAYEPGRLSTTQEAGLWRWQNILRGEYKNERGNN